MAQDFEPSLCPSCGWRSPAGAPTCIRCNYPLTGTALAPSHWTGSPWTVASAALLAFAMLCVSAQISFAGEYQGKVVVLNFWADMVLPVPGRNWLPSDRAGKKPKEFRKNL